MAARGFPPGCNDDFLQLLKEIYGLRQSGRLWHKKLDSVLQEIGFAKVHLTAALSTEGSHQGHHPSLCG
jgi:hypothetical protein